MMTKYLFYNDTFAETSQQDQTKEILLSVLCFGTSLCGAVSSFRRCCSRRKSFAHSGHREYLSSLPQYD